MSNQVFDVGKVLVSAGTASNAGTQVYAMTLNLVLNTPVSFDLRPLIYNKRIESIQGIWVDNSNNTSPFNLTIPGTNQSFTVPANSQGAAPLLVANDATLLFTGAGTVKIALVNIRMPYFVTSLSVPMYTFTGGNLNVSDTILDALAEPGGLAVMEKGLGNADAIIHRRYGKALSASINAATNIIVGAPNVFVTHIYVSLDPRSQVATAENVELNIAFLNAGAIAQVNIEFAAATPIGNIGRVIVVEDVNLLGAAGGDTLTMTPTAAFTAGGWNYTVIGGTTGQQ